MPLTLVPFPRQEPELIQEIVGVSHSNFKRVRELVQARPALAKASWDWGFGDWETALGAASHTGNRDIALYLIEQGAPPTLCSAAMLGQLDTVKATIAAHPGIQRIPGPHGISLLAHARAGGAHALAVEQYLESLGDADAPPETPQSAEELAALTGTYRFGDGAEDRIEIAVNRSRLQFTRNGRPARFLSALGGRTFHPVGAQGVRIRFAASGEEMVLTVHDPGLILTARRAKR